MIQGVFPIMIGDFTAITGKYNNYFGSGSNPNCPDVVVESVEVKVREHLERQGLGTPYKETATVKTVANIVLQNQGGFLQDDPAVAVKAIADTVEQMVRRPTNVNTGAKHSGTSQGGPSDDQANVIVSHAIRIQQLESVIKELENRPIHAELKELHEKVASLEVENEDLLTMIANMNMQRNRMDADGRECDDGVAGGESSNNAPQRGLERQTEHRYLPANFDDDEEDNGKTDLDLELLSLRGDQRRLDSLRVDEIGRSENGDEGGGNMQSSQG